MQPHKGVSLAKTRRVPPPSRRVRRGARGRVRGGLRAQRPLRSGRGRGDDVTSADARRRASLSLRARVCDRLHLHCGACSSHRLGDERPERRAVRSVDRPADRNRFERRRSDDHHARGALCAARLGRRRVSRRSRGVSARAPGDGGARFLFAARLAPMVPFPLVNMAAGLTPMPARTFALVSLARHAAALLRLCLRRRRTGRNPEPC